MKIFLITLGVLAASAAAVFGEWYLTKKKNPFIGLTIPAGILLVDLIVLFALIGGHRSAAVCLTTFYIINIVLLVSVVAFILFRVRRYNLLLAEMNRKNKQIAYNKIEAEKKRRITEQLNGFRCAESTLDIDLQRKIVSEKHLSGRSDAEISASIGCSEKDVSAVLAAFDRYSHRIDSEDSSADVILSPDQEEKYVTCIVNSLPDQSGIAPESYWSKNSVRTLISNDYGSNVSLRFVTAYLRHWGFAPHASQTLRARREEPEVEIWLDRTFEDIRKMASAVSGRIMWIYTVKLDSLREMTKFIGEKPFMYCAVSDDGSMNFKVYDMEKEKAAFKDFISSVVTFSPCKIFAVINENYDERMDEIGIDTKNALADRIEFFAAP